MALTLDSTIGGETANSYVDLTYADDYFDVCFNKLKKANWQALTDDEKTSALLQACSVLEQFKFTIASLEPPRFSDLKWDNRQNRFTAYVTPAVGVVKYYYYQALQFPRNIDVHYTSGALFIPDNVQMAQCEQAVFLLNFDETPMANRLTGITMDRVAIGGEIQLTQEYSLPGSALAPMAYNWIKPYLLTSQRVLRA